MSKRKLAAIALLFATQFDGTTSFGIPLRQFSSVSRVETRICRSANSADYHGLRAGVVRNAFNEVIDDDSGILQKSVVVGVVTGTMGFVYGKVLSATVKTMWSCLPNLLSRRGVTINPTFYITSVLTFGGFAMGILSSALKPSFTVADFVSTMSSVPGKAESLPTCRSVLLKLLTLSLVTSTFGFSVGPEAPMVCAGGLVGASLARRWYEESDTRRETLVYAGAAGALTAFMGIPIAGSIFALELTRSSAGLSSASQDALSPAVVASVAALVVIRGIMLSSVAVGGHFAYGAVGSLSGKSLILTAIAAGTGGALLGTLFHKFVSVLKGGIWSTFTGKITEKAAANTASPKTIVKEKALDDWKQQVLVKTLIGLVVGLISSSFPQTMFWGEGSLQCVVDGQKSAFAATKHGLSGLLTTASRVDPNIAFKSAGAAVQVGLAKLVAIALACAGKFPGGIIFPLFFAAAPFAHAFSSLIPAHVLPVAVMSLMASTQASVTRTPLSTVFILALSASASTELSVMLPAVILSSYIGVWVSQFISKQSYFTYSE